MKRVRFETPCKVVFNEMEERECHSPRPFVGHPPPPIAPTEIYRSEIYQRVLPYSSDPVRQHDLMNSSPYPLVNKTLMSCRSSPGLDYRASNDLEISMLDAGDTTHPRQTITSPTTVSLKEQNNYHLNEKSNPRVLSTIQNQISPPNMLSKDDSFFIRRDNTVDFMKPMSHRFNQLSLNKENEPLAKKAEIIREMKKCATEYDVYPQIRPLVPVMKDECKCHHGIQLLHTQLPENLPHGQLQNPYNMATTLCKCAQCPAPQPPPPSICYQCKNNHNKSYDSETTQALPTTPNAVDKKTQAIQRYEKGNMDIEKQSIIAKEKREPTVADLFKIIKLQNEQLQLLQEKVDKFISTSNKPTNAIEMPVQYRTEQVALESIDSEITERHKISIGVMTSFEMVRTSTIINKEFVKHKTDNAQIQCNRSQISIKEVVSKNQPGNFLDGITPAMNNKYEDIQHCIQENEAKDILQHNEDVDDKTLNELSLYNVQVDNATTPQISPEQSLYLDVRDYSDSDSSSDDQSNVGWTYYNKIMTRVNGVLHDSDMPSSASALYRNTRQQCIQMQFDHTDLSVTKRVKFGDDPLGIHQPHIYRASTDTSLKMNQLAAKYLKSVPTPALQARCHTKEVDMSIATKNYMERHRLLKDGVPSHVQQGAIPKFLDITTLKQQPKFL